MPKIGKILKYRIFTILQRSEELGNTLKAKQKRAAKLSATRQISTFKIKLY